MDIVSSRPTITRKELERVLDCLINDELTKGNTIKTFESNLGELIGVKYPLATNSLTAAYHLIFCALGLKPGDEVIIPSYFNPAPLSALSLVGAKCILVDIADNSYTPSLAQYKEKINENTKAIIFGHTFGFTQPLDEFKDLSIPLIEDISQIIGTENNGKPAGSEATFAVASFSPEMLLTTGNGGLVITNNTRYFSTMKKLRGQDVTDNELPFDYTMTDFQGAMGISQLAMLQDFIKRRGDIAKQYYRALNLTPHKTLYAYNPIFTYQTFPVIFDASSEKVEKYWKKNGVELLQSIGKPLHQILGEKNMDYPNSDRLAKKVYTLPVYPTLSKKEIEKIARTLAKFV